MPTTVVGLIIFVVGLAPGLAYNTYRSASRPVDKPTALRELGSIVLQSVVWDIVALAIFGAVRAAIPAHTPDFGRLVRSPGPYLRTDGPYLFWWAVALLALACIFGLIAATVAASDKTRKGPLAFLAPRGTVTANSAWWTLFKERPPANTRVYAGVLLDDGNYLAGYVLTCSPDSTETADRELTLTAPIYHESPTGVQEANLGVGAVAISARRIQYLTVSYIPK